MAKDITRSEKPVILYEDDQFTYEIMRMCHKEDVIDLFSEVWTTTNLIHQQLGTKKEDHLVYSRILVARRIKERDHILVALEKKTNKLIGFNILKDAFSPPLSQQEIDTLHPNFPIHFRFLAHSLSPFRERLSENYVCDLSDMRSFEVESVRKSRVGDYSEGVALGVRKGYEKNGIGLILQGIMALWYRYRGYSIELGFATHPGTIAMMKYSFPLSRIYFKDYYDPVTKRKPLEQLKNPGFGVVSLLDLYSLKFNHSSHLFFPDLYNSFFQKFPEYSNSAYQEKKEAGYDIEPSSLFILSKL